MHHHHQQLLPSMNEYNLLFVLGYIMHNETDDLTSFLVCHATYIDVDSISSGPLHSAH